jgi:hypothetical protein
MTKNLIALAMVGLLGAFGVGCSSSPCDELADAFEEGGCTVSDGGDGEAECEGAVETAAQCYLDSVADVCAPTTEELIAYTECVGGA